MTKTSDPQTSGGKSATTALILLAIYNMVAHLDRQVIAVVLEPIRQEFALSDTQLGLLSGLAFSFVFALFVFPFSALSNQASRRLLLAGTSAFWGTMTMLGSVAGSFFVLVLTRIGIGIGEAGVIPIAHAVLSDAFPKRRRASALACFQASASVGTAIALIVGGIITAKFGWRVCLFVVSVPGLLISAVLLIAFPKVYDRGADIGDQSKPQPPNVGGSTWALMQRDLNTTVQQFIFTPVLFLIALGSICLATSVFAIVAWTPTYLVRIEGLSLVQAGLFLACVAGLIGFVGTVFSGILADRLATRARGWLLYVPAILILVLKPFTILAFGVELATGLTLVLLAIAALSTTAFIAPSTAMVHEFFVPHLRPYASSLLVVLVNLGGLSLGPLIVGFISDALDPTGVVLGPAIALSQIIAFVGVAFFIYAGRIYDRSGGL